MFFLGIGFLILGLILAIVSGIWGLVQAFSEGTLWGVAYLFIPFAFVIFYLTNWSQRKIRKNFILMIIGLILSLVGSGALGNHITNNFVVNSANIPENPTITTNSENTSTKIETTEVISDPFIDGINLATKAAELAQIANTQTQWNEVAITWHQALVLMKEVPESHTKYEVAQNRIDLYRNNR
ncbi:MAG: hypothetical protein F6K25_20920 [Okeania sp. SIO2G4]|uniref:hypothetical protein n=1 Tax=unclassified Okeania TaxID=2634635 RepID=UPI0013B7DD6B|nr:MULTISPECIES: hypothetical protein [unclassified Okeania]NEP44548.1 hypothetical protein [Okeania sp. SIO2H7]NEP74273.1 hypothetical protein [Okeania sp. SIO2G5]NEP95272.1 hypothetical protein [Okeania sp. SIO2F5]NEQ92995.1 hypothetical protein [Okeania sp. SIO2G4]